MRDIIEKMTLEEKAAMLSGKDFWRTMDYEQYGIPSIEVADGPCGLRKQLSECDHLGIHKSAPATAQLSGPTLAATWDEELIYRIGEALGKECREYGVNVLLGPAVNIQRSPLCGRHFEYYSEDPILAGKVASAYIKGVQSQQVGCCIKHFAANNQETEREYINAVIDERALREIYLAAFEEPVKEAKPWAVMTALNKINGEYCSENTHLLDEVLRGEWKYEGFVVSDWWGVNDRAKALEAGLDLEMPCSQGIGYRKIIEAVQNKQLDMKYVDNACIRLMNAAVKTLQEKVQSESLNLTKHHELVRSAAAQGIVLLKNEESILPISREASVALIGEFMKKPRYKLEGSALVNETKEDIPFEEIRALCGGSVVYAQGYDTTEMESFSKELIQEAVAAAAKAEVAVIFAGLPFGAESEGHDRKHIHLPENQLELIQAVSLVQSNVVVILANGGPVDMPWASRVKGIFECFLAGQGMGGALAALLYGIENPSGKLPFSFPAELSESSSFLFFPGDKVKVEYNEGIFVGYRYYDKKKVTPLFPFGHGLSYTQFEYTQLILDKKKMEDTEILTVSVKVRNVGEVIGKEVIQLYIGQFDSIVKKPEKEMKAFRKIELVPGEEKTIRFELSRRAFAYYHVDLQDWYVDAGEYKILVGSSSRDIRLEGSLQINPRVELPKKITGWSKVSRFTETQAGRECLEEIKAAMHSYVDHSLTSLFRQENLEEELLNLDIRMLTLYTQTVINNDIMEEYLRRCNEEYILEYRKEVALKKE